jgi:two-component system, chemotaxis family, chemotaxis protein CheY
MERESQPQRPEAPIGADFMQDQAADRPVPPPHELGMPKLLVIEDNTAVRTVAARVLRSAGHEVTEADTGKSGVAAVVRERPDLIITDIFMPEQEGVETIRQIRELDPSIPIIVISSLAEWGDQKPLENARMVGADLALEKPFPIQDLVSAVTRLLEEGRAETRG